MDEQAKKDLEEFKRTGTIGDCARQAHRECGLKNPLLCKRHHAGEMRRHAALSWQGHSDLVQ